MLQIETTGADQLRVMARRIRQVGDPRQVRKDLTKGLKDGAKPAADRVKAAAMALPARPGRGTGLRRRMAAATSVQVRTGGRDPAVAVRISRARMGAQAALPKVTNEGHWRHPVFGNRGRWVVQRSQPGWFDNAARSGAPAVRTELQKVLDDMERKLSRRI